MDRRRLRPYPIFAIALLLSLALSPVLTPATNAQRPNEPIDLAAMILTSQDLEEIGYEGYGLWSGTPYTLSDDVSYIADTQGMDPAEVEEVFTQAGHAGSYTHIYTVPADTQDPDGEPLYELYTTAFVFADAEAAEAAYDLITDEREMAGASDIDNAGLGIGDDSELTTIMWESDANFGLPNTQVELEILIDRVVLDVSTYNYDPELVGMPIFGPDEFAMLEEAGERLVERTEDALNGDTPNLDALAVKLESNLAVAPYLTYQLLDDSPIRGVYDTDDAYETRVENYEARGQISILRREQILTEETTDAGSLRYYTNLIVFEDKNAAEEYMADTEDRYLENASYDDFVMVDVEQVGDESIGLSAVNEYDEGEWNLNQYFLRVGETVAVLWVEQDSAQERNPVVSFEAMTEIAEYQAECLEDGACEDPLEIPVEVQNLIEDIGDSLLGPRD